MTRQSRKIKGEVQEQMCKGLGDNITEDEDLPAHKPLEVPCE